jgi:hypothetical protein
MLIVYILIGLVAVLGLLAVVVAMQPAAFRLERQATMAAPPAQVFPQVNDFHNWRNWSPWEKIDPNLQRTYEGPAAGPGARYHWLGNKQVGEGQMTITDSRPSDFVNIKLEFLKPFQATNLTEFKFAPSGGGTTVTWTMTGERNFMMKAFGLLMSMEKIVGKQFDEGLANMKAVVERGSRA